MIRRSLNSIRITQQTRSLVLWPIVTKIFTGLTGVLYGKAMNKVADKSIEYSKETLKKSPTVHRSLDKAEDTIKETIQEETRNKPPSTLRLKLLNSLKKLVKSTREEIKK